MTVLMFELACYHLPVCFMHVYGGDVAGAKDTSGS